MYIIHCMTLKHKSVLGGSLLLWIFLF